MQKKSKHLRLNCFAQAAEVAETKRWRQHLNQILSIHFYRNVTLSKVNNKPAKKAFECIFHFVFIALPN